MKKATTTIIAEDNLEVTLDTYFGIDSTAPLIMLFHQAGYSRGEYIEIAPELVKLGFNCIAIDQRSGKEVNGVINETHLQADIQKKETQYVHAIPDLKAALSYACDDLGLGKIIIWGSSYSAALTFWLASEYPDKILGILAFSPGEYFTINNEEIKYYAKKVICPVFISSAKYEKKLWWPIFNIIDADKSYYLPESKGYHGSKALWKTKGGSNEAWLAVQTFLEPFLVN